MASLFVITEYPLDWNIWKRNSGLPEVWDINFMQPAAQQYPLRPGLIIFERCRIDFDFFYPEFVESTYYLYRVCTNVIALIPVISMSEQATRDTFYLDVGERVLYDITLRAKVQCGLTGILDLRTNQRDDRMESFVLSETLKVRHPVWYEHASFTN